MLVNMKEVLEKAQQGGYAVGAFNIVNYLTAAAVIDEAQALQAPVILQTSQKTVIQIGAKRLACFVCPLAEAASIPVVLHLDHGSDPELAKECVDQGFTSVMIDMSRKPLEENIRICREIAEYAHGKNVSVEGEIGAFVGVEDHVCVKESEAALADVQSASRFVRETGIDFLAPAIGTAHGLYKGEPKIEFDLFADLRKNIPVPMVIHGGTGLADDVFRRLIEMGAAKINISTALKIAYCGTIAQYFADGGKKDPLAVDLEAYKAVREMTRQHIELFGAVGKAAL